jgi:predicted nucleic acid-binding protein
MDIVLDTSVLIDALRLRHGRRELLAQLVADGHHLATTALNIAEVYAGMRAGEESFTAFFLESLDCFAVNSAAGKRGGLLKSEWAKKGRTLTLVDTVIAALAIEHGCNLLTDNRKDFPMPKLTLYPLL